MLLALYILCFHAIFAGVRPLSEGEAIAFKAIFALAEQNIGCYYNFHELATVTNGWSPDDLDSLIFPNSQGLTDMGFLQIVPYFTRRRDADFDWRTTPLQPEPLDDMQVHGALKYFRHKYCYEHGKAILYPPVSPDC